MSSPLRKSAFRAPPSRSNGERNSPATSTERAPKASASSVSGTAKKITGGGKGTIQTEVLKRRLERLKQNSNPQIQNGAKPKSGMPTVAYTSGSNSRVDSPQSTPTPVNTSTPQFVRRMSENDPRRNLIKSGISTKRKASFPQSSPRSFNIVPSPLAATATKATTTSNNPNSEANSSVSQNSTRRGNSIKQQANTAVSKKTRPQSSSPKTSIGSSKMDKRTSKATPHDSDISRTSTPDRMIRVISCESTDEGHIPSTQKDSSLPGQNPSQREDRRGGPNGDGLSLDRKNSANTLDGIRGTKSDAKHSYMSNGYDEDSTNVELELRSLKSESDTCSSVVSERTRRKKNNKKNADSEKRKDIESSSSQSKKVHQKQHQVRIRLFVFINEI
nr:LOW QUALITY PROTEIN: probable serine/threonine-protein kinase dyrk2 [Lytechinus pictus]